MDVQPAEEWGVSSVNKNNELTYQLRKSLLALQKSLVAARIAQDFEAQKELTAMITTLSRRLKILSIARKK